MPAWPAYLLLFASIPLLVPTLARRLGDRLRPPESAPVSRRLDRRRRRPLAGVPAAAIASLVDRPTTGAGRLSGRPGNFILTSVETASSCRRVGSARPRSSPGRREARGGPTSSTASTERPARGRTSSASTRTGARTVLLLPLARSRPRVSRQYVDPAPPPGGATYRIGVATNWVGRPRAGRRLRLQSRSARCSLAESRPTRSSSSATRCARSTFSSVSFEITVE